MGKRLFSEGRGSSVHRLPVRVSNVYTVWSKEKNLTGTGNEKLMPLVATLCQLFLEMVWIFTVVTFISKSFVRNRISEHLAAENALMQFCLVLNEGIIVLWVPHRLTIISLFRITPYLSMISCGHRRISGRCLLLLLHSTSQEILL